MRNLESNQGQQGQNLLHYHYAISQRKGTESNRKRVLSRHNFRGCLTHQCRPVHKSRVLSGNRTPLTKVAASRLASQPTGHLRLSVVSRVYTLYTAASRVSRIFCQNFQFCSSVFTTHFQCSLIQF